MTAILLSSRQREILEAMAEGWELARWRCRDGRQRWHLGEDEVDGRSVYRLIRRALVVQHTCTTTAEMVLTDAGRRAVQP